MSQALLTSPLGLPLGAPKPRVETHPDYAFSFGEEAAELMARARRPLDQWQIDAVTLMLAVREDGKWACFECCEWVCRQQGKGAILEARALTGFLLLGEELIMWSAHEYKTAMEAFRRVKGIIRALGTQVDVAGNLFDVDGILIKVNNTNGEEAFERLDTGARIKFIARSKGSGRGFSGDVNIIDEAFAYSPEQHSALLYTVSARPNPQFIYTSSPPLTGDTGDIMYALRQRGDPTAPRTAEDGPWERDPSLGYRDWGLAGDLDSLDDVDLDDMALAAASNPALGAQRANGSGLTHETVLRERRATLATPAGYARERLGIWPRRATGRSGVIPDEAWQRQRDPNYTDPASVVRPREVVFVVQVNATRSHTTIAAVGARPDGTLLASIVDHRPGTRWAPTRVADLRRRHNPLFVVAQDKGPTGTLLPELADLGVTAAVDRDKPRRGDLVVPWAADVAMAYGLFLDAVVDEGRLCHLDEGPLNVALGACGTRALAGGTAWDYTDPAAGPLLAVTLGTWAVLTLKPQARRSAYEDDNAELMVV
ncbi:hypothetical protein [Micromonospora sp. WMMD980]|uniref:hypothetical protein n=1 Tax=Micromonospora sp. WMMD980 TaxID=3016088 RepID=UPI0024170066|nr:hypothetical protein [Micromonospora sp. WMMD980]MDG4799039.1 hypothetical protein [Micromonospora sp. WMMD980]